ncbi:MAG: hypothetical protein IJ521_09575, partial [Schwartzia sp.]|nr:hypothetical protein [Schwartzia sp. (in: firmicutes)]
KRRISQVVTLPRDFFDWLGKGLEGVAGLRRKAFDSGSRKKTRQGRGGTCSAFPLFFGGGLRGTH